MFIRLKRMLPKAHVSAALAAVALMLGGCSTGYYLQAGVGQMRIAIGKEPIEKLLQKQELPLDTKKRLELSQEVLTFAYETMLLPDNGSYRAYYDTGQPYVVWNVFAAPEFSLAPRTWCFPITGCIAYRGYFKEGAAGKYAAKLVAKGDDVYVGGVIAYSTLGRLHDPVLNTMLGLNEPQFVGLLLHELAHQKLYVKDDSAFNEGFASAVEQEGIRRWNAERNDSVASAESESRARIDAVLALLRQTREKLQRLYASELGEHTMRSEKQRILDEMTASFEQLAGAWRNQGARRIPYGRFFAEGWNNASLAAIATYDDFVPAFKALLSECDNKLDCFFESSARIAGLNLKQRRAELRRLMPAAE